MGHARYKMCLWIEPTTVQVTMKVLENLVFERQITELLVENEQKITVPQEKSKKTFDNFSA